MAERSTVPNILVLVHADDAVRERLRAFGGCNIIFADKCGVTEEVVRVADAMIGEPTPEQLRSAESLGWLQLTWAGADRYTAMPELAESVTLTNASGAFGEIISEYVLGAAISHFRRFAEYGKLQRLHRWQKLCGSSLSGKRALILGKGDIGTCVARRMRMFGVHTVGVNRRGGGSGDFHELHSVRALDSLIGTADIIVGCLPGTPETAGLITPARLALMRKDSLLINVGRGSLVSCDNLAAALSAGRPGGAVIDVADTEPIPDDSPIWDMENVMITPHIAGPSFGGDASTTEKIWDICEENIRRFLDGRELLHKVDRALGY